MTTPETLEVDALRESVLLAQARRQTRQAEKLRLQRERQRPAYAADRGQVKPLGADGPFRLRNNLQAGGVPNGSPVAVSQGLGMSQPAIGGNGAVGLSSLEEEVRQLRRLLGVRYFNVSDPNDAGSFVEPRFDGDLIVTEGNGNWVWNESLNGGEWEQGGGGGGVSIRYGLGDPNQLTVTPIQGIYYDTSSERAFLPNNVSTAWVPLGASVFWDGEEAQNYYGKDIFQGSDGNISILQGSSWAQQWYCPSCSTDPASPGPGAIS